jgi:hypothetical protein
MLHSLKAYLQKDPRADLRNEFPGRHQETRTYLAAAENSYRVLRPRGLKLRSHTLTYALLRKLRTHGLLKSGEQARTRAGPYHVEDHMCACCVIPVGALQ